MLMQKLQRFLYGRYGTDTFNFALLISGVVFSLLGSLFFRPLYFLADILLIYALFRALSKNIPARQRENQAFLKDMAAYKGLVSLSEAEALSAKGV